MCGRGFTASNDNEDGLAVIFAHSSDDSYSSSGSSGRASEFSQTHAKMDWEATALSYD